MKNRKSALKLTFISFGALILGNMMVNTYFPSFYLNLIGLIITSLFIYNFTLRKNDVFSFIMVIYFCSLFPYLISYGGGYNFVAFLCIALYITTKARLPYEYPFNDKWLNRYAIVLILSSSLGWMINYAGTAIELTYSIFSFFGIIFLLLISSRLIINQERIKIFLELNFVLIIYSTLATANKYLEIITIDIPMLPIYGFKDGEYIEGGGIIGSSPFYGEHSMILVILFAVFLIFGNKQFGNSLMLYLGIFISFVNVFMSISRSVFMLSLFGIILTFFLRFRLSTISISKFIQRTIVFGFLGIGIYFVVELAGLSFVLYRLEEIEQKNKYEGGVSFERILDGSAFNRETAFEEGYRRYASKPNWFIGYGWGIGDNNRVAFYVDPNIKRGSAHSQIFAVLFILGWIGFFAYYGLYFRIIKKSFSLTGNNFNVSNPNRIFAYFSMIMLTLFLINEIKVDSISLPTYFGSTIIFLGLAYSNVNSIKILSNHSKY